ncbi:MAG: M23 family metallopeptidase [Gammaproteobacteria bacterium]
MTRVAACLIFLLITLSSHAEVRLEGEFMQGSLVVGSTDPGSIVVFGGDEIRVSDDGVFLIGFNRDEPENVSLVVKLPDGTIEDRVINVRAREYNIDYVEGVPVETVTPRPEDLERIRKDTALIRKARSNDDPRTDFMAGFSWPARGRISGVYGSQRIYNGEPRRPHFGLDIAAPIGTPVTAPAPGIVTLTHPDMFYSGGTIMIDHGHGLSSSFLHLSKISVETGSVVKQGQKIGEIGMSGRANGPHLDWRINLFNIRLDPQLLVSGNSQ